MKLSDYNFASKLEENTEAYKQFIFEDIVIVMIIIATNAHSYSFWVII